METILDEPFTETLLMKPEDRTEIARHKSQLREQFRSYRRTLSDDDYQRLSAVIIDELKLLPEVESANTVHLYWPMLSQREVDTRPLFPWLEERGKVIILPKVLVFNRSAASSPRLAHIRFPGEEELEVNKWGIAEPPSDVTVDASALDLVVVPTLGAGRNGHRIGHGHGYYDEFLASTQAPKVGLVYDACLVERAPAEPHDVPLDIFISETGVIRVSSM